MSARDLDAAGIQGEGLRASYERCRRLNAAHGRTYYLATKLLPAQRRPYVHALYGFARYADEIVDDVAAPLTPRERADFLRQWSDGFLQDLDRGSSQDPICRAVVDTAHRWGIPSDHFRAFLDSMAMDLTVTEYPTFSDLRTYVYGSASVIGLEMLPILGGNEDVAPAAEDLGIAFQLANFIRDVGEDLDRGRLYLPLEDLRQFGLTRGDLQRRIVDERVRGLLALEIVRVRAFSRRASAGIAALPSWSRSSIAAAQTLYVGIVDEVERNGYDVFTRRAKTSGARRAIVAGAALAGRIHRGRSLEPERRGQPSTDRR